MHPRQIRETFRPVLPRPTYSIALSPHLIVFMPRIRRGRCYSPLNFGRRFSRNDAIPSELSAVRPLVGGPLLFHSLLSFMPPVWVLSRKRLSPPSARSL